MTWKVQQGDCLQVLKTLETNSVDLIVTDPPYGISFMGKKWDKALPSTHVFIECHRVLKPGAFAFVMSGARADQLARMIIKLQDAGFLIHFTPIFWTYASGFPKAANISKLIDKRAGVEPIARKEPTGGITGGKNTGATEKGWHDIQNWYEMPEPVTPEAKQFKGAFGGFQPKPAVEVIIVAMKPMLEKTFVEQALRNDKGVTWMDDCSIPFKSDDDKNSMGWKDSVPEGVKFKGNIYDKAKTPNQLYDNTKQGRFPANLLCSDDVLDDGSIYHSGGGNKSNKKETEQSQVPPTIRTEIFKANSGSFSRYFDLDAWWQKKLETMPDSVKKCFPFLIVPKPSKAEKNKGCENLPERQVKGGGGLNNTEDDVCGKYGSIKAKQKNYHPTVKPVKLMSYLIELGSRKDELVVDPFAGSGTVGIAAVLLERNSICIELDKDFAEICKARIGKAAEHVQKSLF